MNSNNYGSGTGPRAQQALRDHKERRALAEDLARWAGQGAQAAHDEGVAAQPEGRHYTHCCMHARSDAERDEYAFAMDLPIGALRRRHAAEREERARLRAQREGAPPTA